MKKKIVSILVVAALGMGCIACGNAKSETPSSDTTTSNKQSTAEAESKEEVAESDSKMDESLFQYEELENGNIAVWGYEDEVEEIVIPETIDGKTVEVIGYGLDSGGFKNRSELKSVVIPDTVKVISKESFMNTSLESVVLGNGVEEIRNHAFAGGILGDGYTLKEVTIPASVKFIGEGAFSSISTLSKVVFLGDVENLGISLINLADEVTFYGPANSNVQAYAEKFSYNFVVQ